MASGKMCTSRALWLPSARGITVTPTNEPCLMSESDAFTTPPICGLSASARWNPEAWDFVTIDAWHGRPASAGLTPATGLKDAARHFVACPQMIEAPHAASCYCEIKEHEAVDDSQLTRVQERKEAPRRVRYE